MEVLTGEQMRRVDRRTIEEWGVPSLLLMESAGRGVAVAILQDFPQAAAHGVLVLCGKGNNGGDGLVAARHLARLGVTPRVLLFGRAEDVRGDVAHNLQAARGSGLVVEEVPDESSWRQLRGMLSRSIVVVDALLGTGIKGGVRGLLTQVIRDVNDSATDVASIDLPSGLDADSAAVAGPAIGADRTYTLCRPKLPLVMEPASLHAGRWSVVPIGIPDEAVHVENPDLEWLDDEAVRGLLSARAPQAHKGTYGHLLAVAGSTGKAGAAVLVARGALRTGAGLVTVGTPASCLPVVAAQQAEVMTTPLPETASGALARGASGAVQKLLAARDALAIGPGLGTASETRNAVISIISRGESPTVIDADGLNAFAAGGKKTLSRLQGMTWPLVVTPHPGEAGRLLDSSAASVQDDRLGSARKLAENTGAVVVLKGHRTLVATPEGHVAINSRGNPGMATAGTGDVLTGIVGALLARGLDGDSAARLAVFLHGDAGDRAAAQRGEEGLIASDLVDQLPASLLELADPGEPTPW
jgi:NAD(P)H-hydrate epimerase